MLRALDRKLLRELWQLRGQVLSIGLVVACGVLTAVALRGTYEALAAALERYYHDYRFADVFVSLERAPQSVAERVAELPGVAEVQTRVEAMATLDVPGLAAPALGQILSVPPRPEPTLNDLYLVRGRYLSPEDPDEVLVNQSFAEANGLGPGDELGVLLERRWRRFRIAGLVLSPDFISETAPGSLFPDDRRFGVLRMRRDVLASAAGLEGAFNELAVKLSPGAREEEVIARIDHLIEPYGGRGAHGREEHPSHVMVTGELEQNRVTGTAIPALFLLVAAFLLSIVLGRLVGTQRGEIAVLKAFGYTHLQVGRHYLRFALGAVLLGAAVGIPLGALTGSGLVSAYKGYFRFPDLEYRLRWQLAALAVGVSLLAAGAGALGAVRRAVRLPPAEAMRPESPVRFRPGPVERLGLGRLLSSAGRLIVRNVERRPWRSAASSLGVALAVALLVLGFAFYDAVEVMTWLQFERIQREDLAVTFTDLRAASVRHALDSLPGVRRVELFRTVPARVSHRQQERSISLTGVPAGSELRQVVDRHGVIHPVPPAGLLMGDALAKLLGVQPGDQVRVSVLEGRRPVWEVEVVDTVDELFGLSAYMDYDTLHRLLGEAPASSGAWLAVEREHLAELNRRLKGLPAVAGVYSPAVARRTFEEQVSESLLVSVGFMLVLAGVLTVGVVYNGARVALSERQRELASLRVLGFTRREVTVLLLGEQGVLTLVAIPLGWLLGLASVAALISAFETEQFRIPVAVSGRTLLVSGAMAAAAAGLAGLAVGRRLQRTDLVEVLKTRE